MRIAPTLLPDGAMTAQAGRWPSGMASVDAALGGGLAYGRVHEIYAAEAGDAGAAGGFAAALAAGMGQARCATALWLRTQRAVWLGGQFQANGWADLGGSPGAGLLGVVPDAMTLLRAAADALRCPALSVVIVEAWGVLRELDLTASRRLALAAEKSGVPLLLLRIDARPVPSAAQTRWQVAAAPSRALPGQAPGHPAFDISLLRQKSGPCGLDWQVEWDRDRRKFRDATLSGAVVSVPADRPPADAGIGFAQPDGRYAA